MHFTFEYRPSDSPFVETIWRTESEDAGTFTSLATIQSEMVVQKLQGQTYIAMRGPETKASLALCPEDGEFFGITFKLGTFMPHLPPNRLVDGAKILPEALSQSFWLHGSAWEIPTFDNVDIFVNRLIREGLLVRDPIVDAVLQEQRQEVSLRSVQRRFLRATGLTHGTVHQIERAHHAVALLEQGVSILDTVDIAGYADQPHLTRSLKRFIGQTPAQIITTNGIKRVE